MRDFLRFVAAPPLRMWRGLCAVLRSVLQRKRRPSVVDKYLSRPSSVIPPEHTNCRCVLPTQIGASCTDPIDFDMAAEFTQALADMPYIDGDNDYIDMPG